MIWKLHEAVRILSAGGVIACPTETVYGLSCDPFSAAAVVHLLTLKQRSIRHGVILMASDFAQLAPLLQPLNHNLRKRVATPAGSPLTWVLPCLPEIPAWLRGEHDTLAVRITTHPLANELCRQWGGPLVSTSANLHGRNPARDALAVRKAFNGRLDYILHGSTGKSHAPSRICDGITGKILRG
jgi:L-threonylcarbamoyladenylate synthase